MKNNLRLDRRCFAPAIAFAAFCLAAVPVAAAPLPGTPESEAEAPPSGPVIGDDALPAPVVEPELQSADEPEAADSDTQPGMPRIYRGTIFLPDAVREKVEALKEAAKAGDPEAFRAIIDANGSTPYIGFSGSEEESEAPADAVEALKSASGDDHGQEILAILLEVLEAGYVHVDKETPGEVYLWPYFARYPLHELTPEQRVELFRLVTAYDAEEMERFGAYNFYRVGISPDGVWQFFIAGD